mmetsp:Transcript_14717/g.19565  ORF Transcript_14717/g.19565 Transcript_14717/m.19565 type:complete len:191 (-) Transcript_14717:926-1498(-)
MTVEGYRTDGIEKISVCEAAFHTGTNRFYELNALDIRGWKYNFAELHHRKAIIINIGTHTEEARIQIQTLLKISNEITPIDGTRILAFPCYQYDGDEKSDEEIKQFVFDDCGVHPNDTSFKIMAKVKVDGPEAHPVFTFLKSMTKITNIGCNFGAFFYVNRNSHIQGVANSAQAILSVLEAELPYDATIK